MGEEPNRVYALGMCFPGADANDCSACIKSASGYLIPSCPNQTDAYYWSLDPTLCLVRYSNISFTGSAAHWEIQSKYIVYNTADISSNLTEFKAVWEKLIGRTIAAASSSDDRYKVGKAALETFQNIYALMLCTPDISPADCDYCLRQSVMDYQSCCTNNTGGYVMRPICFFRWQFTTFSKAFGNITLPPLPSSSPPPPPIRHQPLPAGKQATTTNNSRGGKLENYCSNCYYSCDSHRHHHLDISCLPVLSEEKSISRS